MKTRELAELQVRTERLLAEGRPSAAWQEVAPALAGDDDPRLVLLASRVLGALGRWRAAAALLGPLLDEQFLPRVRAQLARALCELDLAAEALPHAEAAAAELAGGEGTHEVLAAVLARLGQTGDALALLEAALLERPGDLALQALLARRLREAGRPGEAVSLARDVLSADPRQASAWCSLGLGLVALGRATEAMEVFECAVQALPAQAELAHFRAELEGTLHATEAAIRRFEADFEATPDDPSMCERLADLLTRRGELERDLRIALRALEFVPELAERPAAPAGAEGPARAALDEALRRQPVPAWVRRLVEDLGRLEEQVKAGG